MGRCRFCKDRPTFSATPDIFADDNLFANMFYYTIDSEAILEMVDGEVSRVADAAYGENGVSLYDQIVITERDEDTLNRMLGDAEASLVARLGDICRFSSGSTPCLEFYVPDFDETANGDIAEEEITKFIAYSVTGQFLSQRHPASVPEYTDKTALALRNVISILKTRKAPLESWT